MIKFNNKSDKINKDIDRFQELYLNKEVPLRQANGGGGSPSVGCINPDKIAPILAGINDNPINVDLTFKKKIKVI